MSHESALLPEPNQRRTLAGSDPLDLAGERILITGGSGALGQAIVATLSEHGAVLTNLDLATGTDVSDPDAVAPALDRIEQEAGLPTIGLCHAGVVGTHGILDYPIEEFDLAQRSNLRAAFVTAQELSRRWVAQGVAGHLIFTSSWVAANPWPDIAAYTTAKAGTVQLMRQFAVELAPHGIRANAIAPGIVGAGMAKHQWDTDADYRRRASTAVPLGELQTPQSVADAFLFMCSPLASYMTGSVLTVDGGASLRPLD